jgi:hypothetical protein
MDATVNGQRPPGRRRALHQPEPVVDEFASHTELAAMWRGVSRAQQVLGRRQSHFENTPVEDRLAEQISLVPMLHDWRSVTAREAEELTYLLGLYAEPVYGATRGEAAEAINAAIRRMVIRRGKRRPATAPDTLA